MQNLTIRVVLCGATLLLAGGKAHSQILDNFGGSATAGATTAVPAPVPEFKWDYRFDAQYNSTIKPYLRWYRRQSNAQRSGVRYPYYHGPQPYYGSGSSSGYIPDYVVPRQSSWFNPYKYLNQGQTSSNSPAPRGSHGVLQYLSRKSPAPGRPAVEVKTAWIKHELATDSLSILFTSPVGRSRDQFFEAEVTTYDGKLTNIDWVDAPSESLTTIVAQYRP